MEYLADDGTDTLTVPGREETVTFRRMATWDDEMELVKRMARYGDLDEQERAYAFRAERTLLMITAWTLRGRDGELLPMEAHTLRKLLSKRVAAWLDQEANLRYEGGRPEAAEGPFDSRSPQPSSIPISQ